MPFVPVDNDPFAEQPQDTGATQQPSDAGSTSGSFVPVDHDPFAAAAPAIPTTAEGLKNLDKQLAAGAIEGASVALSPPSTANFLERGADWLWNKVMPAGPAGPRPVGVYAPGGLSAAAHEPIQRAIDAVTAPAGAPTTPTEEGARRVGSYIGGGAVGGVGPVRSVLGAGGDILAGDLFKGTPYETPARVIGGILGASAPTAAARVVAPKPLSPERLAAVNSLEQAGVPMTAGEYTGSSPLKYAEATLSDMPFAGGKAAAIKSQQGEALAKEVMARAGSPGELMTRENMEKGFERLGKTYEDIGTRNDLKFDPQFGQDLNKAISDYENSVHIANNKPTVYKEVSKAYNAAIGGGGMSGIQYQNWRSQLGKGVNTLNRNGDYGSAQGLKDIRDALDSAFVRSVKDPADAAKLMETNRQYSAMKGVQKGIERAGGDPILGLLGQNPAATLRSMATGTKGHRGFTDLADAANTVLKPLPNSGTAQRMGNILTLGTMVGDFAHGGIPIATAARMGIPPILARGLMSDFAQNLLKNQKFANVKISPQRGLLPAFAANPGILSQLQYLGQ
jgi:hypothetical protein